MPSKKPPTPGTLTTMPSVKRSLGPYVVLKKRAGGKAAAYFQVPARLRPPGWAPAIRLCSQHDLPADIDAIPNEAFGALLVEGAKLLDRLNEVRRGSADAAPARSFPTLVRTLQKSSAWGDLKPKTRDGYVFFIGKVLTWSAMAGHPDPTTLSRARIEAFLSVFNDRPTTKKRVLEVIRLLMEQAVALAWRTDNPAKGIRVKIPKPKLMVWEQEDVDTYVRVARAQGMDSIALIILLEWEIGQRLTDVREFRPGAEYDPDVGIFSFDQSKTVAPVAIEISETLRELLQPLVDDKQLFLFRNERTGKAYTENRLSQSFRWVRKAVVAERVAELMQDETGSKAELQAKRRELTAEIEDARPLVLRQLRHSCVVQLARAGCTIAEIAAITGHSLGSVTTILSKYLPRDSTVARNAQMKRGIIKSANAS
ncbi:hypothetical protein [Brevundimonas olei]|uniref:tyrosine-type recombinase/integrase n=1 Tax=Brevundimonas olei TaxID=657642 RepID=UPI0031DD74E3